MSYSINIKGQFIRGGVKWVHEWVIYLFLLSFVIKHKSVAGVGDAKLNNT